MKRIVFLIGILGCMFNVTQAKEKVIECPPYIASSTTAIEIEKIIMSDTATVMYIKAFYAPKQWIAIAKSSFLQDDKGQSYPIRDGIGITIGEQFWMPESGETEFQLIFPPVSSSAKTVDFYEGEGIQNPFNIWGIQLGEFSELKLPDNAKVHSIDMNAELPIPNTEFGKATFKGQILEYKKDFMDALTLYVAGAVTSIEENEIKVNDDGTFSKEINILGTVPAFVYVFGSMIDLYLEPGQVTELIINTRELTRQRSRLLRDKKPAGEAIFINGPLASLSQEMNKNKVNIQLLGSYEEVADLDMNGFKKLILGKKAKGLEDINAAPISKAAKQVNTINAEISAIQLILQGDQLIKTATALKNKLSNQEVSEYINSTKIDIPEDYYDVFDQVAMLNTSQAVYAKGYANITQIPSDKQKEMFIKAWGTDKGFFFNTVNAKRIYRGIKDFNPLTKEQEEQLATFPESYRLMFKLANENLLRTIEEQKLKTGYIVNEIPQVPDDKLFDAIVSKYKGKVILVDFWATWCVPCLAANKTMAPMKEEMKDVVYLYLTGETSPIGTWKMMIPDIHGEHYRVSGAQWTYIMNSFGIAGIPTYYIVDVHGNISFKHTAFPGVEKMKSELEKAAN